MIIVPFKRWQLRWLEEGGVALGGGNTYSLDAMTLEYLEQSRAWTGVIDGRPLACGGFMEQWPGRTLAWMYLNRDSAPHMVSITRAVKAQLAKVKGRIEFAVRADFPAGNRWAMLLGFEVETPIMKAYGPEGEDCIGYVRFN